MSAFASPGQDEEAGQMQHGLGDQENRWRGSHHMTSARMKARGCCKQGREEPGFHRQPDETQDRSKD